MDGTWSKTTSQELSSAPDPGDAIIVAALVPQTQDLPELPRGNAWATQAGINALVRSGASDSDERWPDTVWRLPGFAALETQAKFDSPAALHAALLRDAQPLQLMLEERRDCREYRITVSARHGGPQAANMRVAARLAQDLSELCEAVRATPEGLLAPPAGEMLMALSVMVRSARMAALLRTLTDGKSLARAQGLELSAQGPDALRCFPVSPWRGAELILSQDKMKRAG